MNCGKVVFFFVQRFIPDMLCEAVGVGMIQGWLPRSWTTPAACSEPYAFCWSLSHFQVMRESLAKLENLCLGGTAKDQDWMASVEDTRWARVKLTLRQQLHICEFDAPCGTTGASLHFIISVRIPLFRVSWNCSNKSHVSAQTLV